mmetsp:Transcript_45529/g.126329  ORF Transcript_45529/g.126329 Transcript_45529/m.126329 type:complete len:477 (-) Transcript_45529:1322-2752(-)
MLIARDTRRDDETGCDAHSPLIRQVDRLHWLGAAKLVYGERVAIDAEAGQAAFGQHRAERVDRIGCESAAAVLVDAAEVVAVQVDRAKVGHLRKRHCELSASCDIDLVVGNIKGCQGCVSCEQPHQELHCLHLLKHPIETPLVTNAPQSSAQRSSSNAQNVLERWVLERLDGSLVILPPSPLGSSTARQMHDEECLLEGQVAELVECRRGDRFLLERLDERHRAIRCSQPLPSSKSFFAQHLVQIVRCEFTPEVGARVQLVGALAVLGQHVGHRDALHHVQPSRKGARVSVTSRAQRTSYGRNVQLQQIGRQAAALLAMRKAQNEHGELHRRLDHLLHEHDHTLEQRVELGTVGATENAPKVLIWIVCVLVLVERIDESVVHLQLDERRSASAVHPQIVEEIAKMRGINRLGGALVLGAHQLERDHLSSRLDFPDFTALTLDANMEWLLEQLLQRQFLAAFLTNSAPAQHVRHTRL